MDKDGSLDEKEQEAVSEMIADKQRNIGLRHRRQHPSSPDRLIEEELPEDEGVTLLSNFGGLAIERPGPQDMSKRRMRYMLLSICVSFVGYAILLGLSLLFGEHIIGNNHGIDSYKKWLKWALINLAAPLILFAGMVVIQIWVFVEDTPDQGSVRWNKVLNLLTYSVSKIVYASIIDCPGGANVRNKRIAAHVAAWVIEACGAVLLWRWNKGQLDQGLPS